MALTSPGVEVTIVDQSQYLPAPTNSIPFVLLATAQDKANPNGTGIAQGTTAATAGNILATWSRAAAVATVSFTVDWTFTVRTTGASGTMSGGGTNVLTATTSLTPATGVATAQTVDTTALNYLKLTFNQSAANTIGIIYATMVCLCDLNQRKLSIYCKTIRFEDSAMAHSL